MDKYEFNLKADQMLKLSDRGDYATAMKIADGIDWRRVSSVSLLTRVSEIYEKNREYNEAKEVLLLAFERAPISRGILFKLTELALKDGKTSEAEAYYREFKELAPEDVRQHLLCYMILKAKNASYDQILRPLEIYNSTEYDEKWLYELASAYHEAGRSEDCVRTCDRVMLLFGTGEYVDKAIALKTEKEGYALTPYQQSLVDEKEQRQAQLKAMEEEYLIRNSVDAPAPAVQPAAEMPLSGADDGSAAAPAAAQMAEAEDPAELIRRMQNQFRSEAGVQQVEEQPTVEISEERSIEAVTPQTEVASEAELIEAVRQDKGVEIPGFVDSEDMVAAAEAAAKPAEQDEIDREIEAHIAEIEAEMKAAGAAEEEAKEEPERDSEMERYAAMVRAEAEREAEREAARLAAASAIPERSVSYEEAEVKVPEEELPAAPAVQQPEELPAEAPVYTAHAEESVRQAPIPEVPDGETRVLPKIGQEMQSGETKVLPTIGNKVKPEEPAEKPAAAKEEAAEAVKAEIVRPGDGNGVVRGRTPEEGFQLAVAELKRIHTLTGITNSVAKIKAEKLNTLGVKNAESKMAGRDLIIEEAGDLSEENLAELIDLLKREDGSRTILLVDNPLQIKTLLGEQPLLASLLHAEAEEAPEAETAPAVKPAPIVKKPEVKAPAAAPKAEAKPAVKVPAAEKPAAKPVPAAKIEAPAENMAAANDPERAYEEEELSIDAFAHYAGDYAKKIDCVITGKSMLALYERIEIMQEDGVPLTRMNAEALIEEAADSAENPPLMKKLGSLFSHKYDKDGMLILKEEDFIS